MGVVPGMPGLHREHRGIFLPRGTQGGPAEVCEELRLAQLRQAWSVVQPRRIEEAHGSVEEIAIAVLPLLHLVNIP